jgi:hypothetical protein
MCLSEQMASGQVSVHKCGTKMHVALSQALLTLDIHALRGTLFSAHLSTSMSDTR